MISNQKLIQIASFGGFVVASTGYIFHYLMQRNIKESECFNDAIDALYMHKKAIPYLGKPVGLGRISYGDGQRMLEHEVRYKWYNIPLTGTNTKGKLYYEVTLNPTLENKPEVSKIEITFNNIPGKTFTIRDYKIK